MNRIKRALLLLLCGNMAFAQSPKEKGLESITERSVQGHLEFLASDWMEGREMGRRGEFMAGDWLISQFKINGLEPAGEVVNGERQYYQTVHLTESWVGQEQALSIHTASGDDYALTYKTDFDVRPAEVSATFNKSALQFVGYGLDHAKEGYNNYAGINKNIDVALCFYGYPGRGVAESAGAKRFGKLSDRSLYRKKEALAIENGIRLLVEIVPNEVFYAANADNYPLRFEEKGYEGDKRRESFYDSKVVISGGAADKSVTVVRISERMGKLLLPEMDFENFHALHANMEASKPFALKKASVSAATQMDSRIIKTRNVLAMIPGKKADQYMVVGAHYDHLGMHDGYIWNGADDNGTGVTAVMSIAKAFMTAGEQPEYTVIFAGWCAEEKGLMGSESFVRRAQKQNMDIRLYQNFDMLGRNDDDNCSFMYTKSAPQLEQTALKNNEKFGIGAKLHFSPQERPVGGSDNSSFAKRDIPIFWMFTWGHDDYHQTSDQVDKIEWSKLTRLIRLSYLNMYDFSRSSEF